MLRVWGGGIYEDDRFYQLCDSLGLMIWQDYMFACALYPGDDEFLENVAEEITQQTDRLRGYACMALWCGNNEVSNAWFDWGWQSVFNWIAEDSARIWHQNAYLFNELIPEILQGSGVETDYLPSSPVWGWGHDESFTEGDNHYWGVWWGEEPFESYREHTGRFMSEFGFQAWPSWETLRKIHGESEIEIGNDIMKSHQKHPFGDRLIREYMARYIGKTEDVKLFHKQSQQVQAYGISEAIRWFRVQPKCAGSLYWQLNDCWPAISWSSIDYYGEWKSLHYAVRDAYAPYLLYAVKDSNILNCYVVSDAPESVDAVLYLSIKNSKGEEVLSENHALRTNIYNTHDVFFVSLPETLLNESDWFMKMSLISGNEKLAEYIFRSEL
jgi:beta-mannosidase